jgi:hypothetical protein
LKLVRGPFLLGPEADYGAPAVFAITAAAGQTSLEGRK